MNARISVLVLSVLLIAGAAVAADGPAPQPVALHIGQTLTGGLVAGDRTEPDGSYYDLFQFEGREGQSLAIEMRSREIDAVLALYVDGRDAPIAFNDNAARRGKDARIDVVLPQTGRYVIVANSATGGETGHYALSLHETKPVQAQVPSARSILLGKTVQGELSARSGRAGDASLYDLYRFRGKAGETVRVSLSSNDFEPFVSLHQSGQTAELAFARDRGQRSAEVSLILPSDGDYEVWANAATAGQSGRYALWLGRDGADQIPQIREIAYGDTVRGELTAGDAKARDDSFYDVYRFHAQRGDEITVTMRSPMLQAYLSVHRQGRDGVIATASDDGYGGRDAELTFTAPDDGFYDVWANTLGAGQRGQYVVSLERIGRRTGAVARNP